MKNTAFLLAAVILRCLSYAHAESIEEWLSAAPASGIEFTPYPDAHKTTGAIPTAGPTVHLGQVRLIGLPAGEYPVELTLNYRGQSNPRHFGNLPAIILGGSNGAVSPKESLGPLWHQESWTVSQADSVLPVSDLMQQSFMKTGWRSRAQSVASLTAQVTGRSGQILARRWIVPCWQPRYGHGHAIVLSDPEADRFFRDNQWGDIRQVPRLAPAPSQYRNAAAIWVDAAALADPTLDASFYRRLLLMGANLTGRATTVAQLYARVGLSTATAVVGTVVQPMLEKMPSNVFNTLGYYGGQTGEFAALAPLTPLTEKPFAALRKASVLFLTAYGALQVAVMAIGFLTWPPEKRVRLWAVVPLTGLVFTLAAFIIAPRILPLGPRSTVVSLEWSFRDWPETFVETSFESLGFADTVWTWRLPAGAEMIVRNGAWMSHQYQTSAIHREAGASRLTITGTRGTRPAKQVAYWTTNPPPIRVDADGGIAALDDFDAAWMWTGSEWKALGKLGTGSPVDPALGQAAFKRHAVPNQDLVSSLAYDVPFSQRLRLLMSPVFAQGPLMRGQGIFIGTSKKIPGLEHRSKKRGDEQTVRLRIYGFDWPEAKP